MNTYTTHLLLILLLSTHIVAAPASVTIKIDHDTIITAPLLIPSNTTLVVSPGVSIYMDGYLPISVEGLLIAEGTAEQPITFTGKNRPRGSVDKPCWQGLGIRGEHADAVLKNVRIEGANRNVIWAARPVIDSCTFTGNHTALFCSGAAAPRIGGCNIYGNIYGLVAESSTPLLLDNTITGNKVGLHLQLGAKPAIGRNAITANGEDIRTEDFLGSTRNATSVKYLWDLMNQLY